MKLLASTPANTSARGCSLIKPNRPFPSKANIRRLRRRSQLSNSSSVVNLRYTVFAGLCSKSARGEEVESALQISPLTGSRFPITTRGPNGPERNAPHRKWPKNGGKKGSPLTSQGTHKPDGVLPHVWLFFTFCFSISAKVSIGTAAPGRVCHFLLRRFRGPKVETQKEAFGYGFRVYHFSNETLH